MKQLFTLVLLVSTIYLSAQTIADFENFNLTQDTFLNGNDGNGGFASGSIFLPNDYTAEWDSWSGWAISSTTDTTTPGFGNQYSAIAGSGAAGSTAYGVSFVSVESIVRTNGSIINGISLTNTTYAYLSMLEGDDFAKKFGGATGTDDDFFLLTIKKYKDGMLSQDSVNFYLADYRFEDNSQDYIIKDWTFVDLSSLGATDSLSFTLSSSDNGQFGMNTPAYFCIDDIRTMAGIVAIDFVPTADLFEMYPNPTADFLQFNNLFNQPTQAVIYSMTGQLVLSKMVLGNEALDVRHLSRGTYTVHVFNEEVQAAQLLVKQ